MALKGCKMRGDHSMELIDKYEGRQKERYA